MGQYRMPHVKTRYLMVASEADSYQMGRNLGHRPSTGAELAYAQVRKTPSWPRSWANFSLL